jgi:hypothetical protein
LTAVQDAEPEIAGDAYSACKAPTGFTVWPLALAASSADRASVKAELQQSLEVDPPKGADQIVSYCEPSPAFLRF